MTDTTKQAKKRTGKKAVPKKATPKKAPAKKKSNGKNKAAKKNGNEDKLNFDCKLVDCFEQSPESLDALIEGINKEAEYVLVKRADEAGSPSILRRPFGIASLDIACGGGPPAGSTTQTEGAAGAGKNALMWHAVRTNQYLYGDASRIGIVWLEGAPDKQHARIIGAVIPDSNEEMNMLNMSRRSLGQPLLSTEEIMDRKQVLGEIVVVHHGSAEQRLDAAATLTALNTCQLIIIDSYGSVATKYHTNTPLWGDPRRAASAGLLTNFQNKLWNALANPVEGRGPMNFTAILALNQIRSKQNQGNQGPAKKGGFQKTWDVSDPYAIKHGKAIDIQLSKGEAIFKGSNKIQVGKWVKWKIMKGKLGTHEGPQGTLPYLFDSGFDVYIDLITTLKAHNMIIDRGSKVDIITEDEVIIPNAPHGEKYFDLKMFFLEEPDAYWKAYKHAVRAAGVECLYRLSNDYK